MFTLDLSFRNVESPIAKLIKRVYHADDSQSVYSSRLTSIYNVHTRDVGPFLRLVYNYINITIHAQEHVKSVKYIKN